MTQLSTAPPHPERPSRAIFFLLGVLGAAMAMIVIYLIISYLQ
jgi:hypothetical protein